MPGKMIDLINFHKGIYFLKLKNNGRLKTIKIAK
jgi:hypothetical protein